MSVYEVVNECHTRPEVGASDFKRYPSKRKTSNGIPQFAIISCLMDSSYMATKAVVPKSIILNVRGGGKSDQRGLEKFLFQKGYLS